VARKTHVLVCGSQCRINPQGGGPTPEPEPGRAQVISRILYFGMTQHQQNMFLTTSPSLTVSSDTARAGGPATSESSGLSLNSRTYKTVPAARLADESSDPFSPDTRKPESTSSSDCPRVGQGKGKGSKVRKSVHSKTVPASGDNVPANRATKQDLISGGNASADRGPSRQPTPKASEGSVVLPFTDSKPQPPNPPTVIHIGDYDDGEGTSGVYDDDDEIWKFPTNQKNVPSQVGTTSPRREVVTYRFLAVGTTSPRLR